LHFYEKINHFGQDPDSRDDTVDTDETSSRRKTIVGAVNSVAFSYNYQQHNMTGQSPLGRDINVILWAYFVPLGEEIPLERGHQRGVSAP